MIVELSSPGNLYRLVNAKDENVQATNILDCIGIGLILSKLLRKCLCYKDKRVHP